VQTLPDQDFRSGVLAPDAGHAAVSLLWCHLVWHTTNIGKSMDVMSFIQFILLVLQMFLNSRAVWMELTSNTHNVFTLPEHFV
jgi:hypothetical protein